MRTKAKELLKLMAAKGEENQNIAECSIAIEHRKFELSKIFSKIEDGKLKYLALINLNLVSDLNIYNGFIQVMKDGKDIDSVCEELGNAYKSALKAFKELCEDCE